MFNYQKFLCTLRTPFHVLELTVERWTSCRNVFGIPIVTTELLTVVSVVVFLWNPWKYLKGSAAVLENIVSLIHTSVMFGSCGISIFDLEKNGLRDDAV